MRVALRWMKIDDKGVVGRETRNEPILMTLSEEDKAAIRALPAEGQSMMTFFPDGTSKADKEGFLDDCENDPYLPLGDKQKIKDHRKEKP